MQRRLSIQEQHVAVAQVTVYYFHSLEGHVAVVRGQETFQEALLVRRLVGVYPVYGTVFELDHNSPVKRTRFVFFCLNCTFRICR